MQKKLIALALASLAGTAFAQSNVTIYGVADVTFDAAQAKSATNDVDRGQFTRVSSNSSYIGFKGVEDLGNGIKAVFQIESAVGLDGNNTGANTNTFGVTRDSFVGLAGGFGTVVGGLITGPTRGLGARMDLNSGATGAGANATLIGKPLAGGGAGVLDTRLSNTVAYISPNFSGFNAVVGYSSGENRTTSNVDNTAAEANLKAYDIGLNYTNGPIDIGYAYANVNFGTNDPSTVNGLGTANIGTPGGIATVFPEKWVNHRLAGSFTFGGGHKIVALWDQSKIDLNAPLLGGAEAKRTTWGLGGKFMVTPAGGVIVQYYQAKDLDIEGDIDDTGARMWEVGYEHALSKRTIVKASYVQVKNDSNAYYDFAINPVAGTAVNTAPGVGADPRVFSVGVRHSF